MRGNTTASGASGALQRWPSSCMQRYPRCFDIRRRLGLQVKTFLAWPLVGLMLLLTCTACGRGAAPSSRSAVSDAAVPSSRDASADAASAPGPDGSLPAATLDAGSSTLPDRSPRDAAVASNDGGASGGRGSDGGASDGGASPTVLVGSGRNAGVGLTCDAQTPCADGLFCEMLPGCFGLDCATYCTRASDSCQSDPCGDSAWCEPIAGSEGGTCIPRVGRNQDCGGPPLGHPEINQCADGLFCSGDSDTCIPVLQPGEVCPTLWAGTDGQACVAGYVCRETQADGSETCVALSR